jgi:hypothetical protein
VFLQVGTENPGVFLPGNRVALNLFAPGGGESGDVHRDPSRLSRSGKVSQDRNQGNHWRMQRLFGENRDDPHWRTTCLKEQMHSRNVMRPRRVNVKVTGWQDWRDGVE